MQDALIYLFPQSLPGDWVLQDDGKGPYIKIWNRPEPIPTTEQLETAAEPARLAVIKRDKLAKIAAMESQYLLPRAVREFMLGALKAEAAKAGLDPMLLPAYTKLKAMDDQIVALRAQL